MTIRVRLNVGRRLAKPVAVWAKEPKRNRRPTRCDEQASARRGLANADGHAGRGAVSSHDQPAFSSAQPCPPLHAPTRNRIGSAQAADATRHNAAAVTDSSTRCGSRRRRSQPTTTLLPIGDPIINTVFAASGASSTDGPLVRWFKRIYRSG